MVPDAIAQVRGCRSARTAGAGRFCPSHATGSFRSGQNFAGTKRYATTGVGHGHAVSPVVDERAPLLFDMVNDRTARPRSRAASQQPARIAARTRWRWSLPVSSGYLQWPVRPFAQPERHPCAGRRCSGSARRGCGGADRRPPQARALQPYPHPIPQDSSEGRPRTCRRTATGHRQALSNRRPSNSLRVDPCRHGLRRTRVHPRGSMVRRGLRRARMPPRSDLYRCTSDRTRSESSR